MRRFRVAALAATAAAGAFSSGIGDVCWLLEKRLVTEGLDAEELTPFYRLSEVNVFV